MSSNIDTFLEIWRQLMKKKPGGGQWGFQLGTWGGTGALIINTLVLTIVPRQGCQIWDELKQSQGLMEKVDLGSPESWGIKVKLGRRKLKFVLDYKILCYELHRHLGNPHSPL